MKIFTNTFRVKAPIQAVADFHRSTTALKRLTPFPVIVQIHHLEPLGEGSIAEFTMLFGPFPVRWVARHVNVDPLHGFTDIQEKGPMLRWEHKHSFIVISDEITEVQDRIEYEYHTGWKDLWTRLLYAPATLRTLFLYRAFVTKMVTNID
ncbi:MAG: cyclase [Anaerolineaceae bacterium]|nr:cyclase [Anaerolineaceae bacterium]